MRSNIQSLERVFLAQIHCQQGRYRRNRTKGTAVEQKHGVRILKTLENLGYIYKDELTNTYAATFRLQSPEMTADPRNITGYQRPILQQLMDIYDETIHFVSAGKQRRISGKMESTKSVRIYEASVWKCPTCTSLTGDLATAQKKRYALTLAHRAVRSHQKQHYPFRPFNEGTGRYANKAMP